MYDERETTTEYSETGHAHPLLRKRISNRPHLDHVHCALVMSCLKNYLSDVLVIQVGHFESLIANFLTHVIPLVASQG